MGKVPYPISGAFPLPLDVSCLQQLSYRISSWTPSQECLMDYLYFLANASLTLRVVEYLHSMPHLPFQFITVIHQIEGWVVKVKMNSSLTPQQDGDFRAFMSELGIPYQPDIRVQMALWSLETGQSVVDVMRRYQVAVVSHGSPDRSNIEAFRQQFTMGLGYCPETLA